MKMKKLGEVT